MTVTVEILVKQIEDLEKRFIQFNLLTADITIKRTSGYLQHNTMHRADVKARLEAVGGAKIKATDVTKELAILWRALSDSDRNDWNIKAKLLKESPGWLNKAAVHVKQVNIYNKDPTIDSDPELVAEEIDLGNADNKEEKKEEKNEEKKEKKEKKQKKEKKEKTEKKEKKEKSVSGEIIFQRAMRADVTETLKETLVNDTEKIKQSDVTREIGKMWKALSDEEREEWNDKASQHKSSDEESA